MQLGWIVILNGAPRSGKSSIVAAIQESFDGPWMNLGVDVHVRHVTPKRYWPGIGLRPGGERPDIERMVPVFYAALYDSIAAHSRLRLNVVVDVGHHSADPAGRELLTDCAHRLRGLPTLFVGVHCPIEVIMERRNAGEAGRENQYLVGTAQDPTPEPVRRWQRAVHSPGIYDFEVDTSLLSPAECAEMIRRYLGTDGNAPTAFQRLAAKDRS